MPAWVWRDVRSVVFFFFTPGLVELQTEGHRVGLTPNPGGQRHTAVCTGRDMHP